MTANLTLAVEVQDVNDNPPIFEHDAYTANVLESEAVNTKVRVLLINYIYSHPLNFIVKQINIFKTTVLS